VTHQQAADAVGRSRSVVSNLLRLLDLAPEVCRLIENRELEMGHARTLAALTDRRQQAEVGASVARKGLSVRETEALVRRLQRPSGSPGGPADGAGRGADDPNVRRLEQELADKLGAKVVIQHSASGSGKLVVSFHSLDELDGILAHIH
jgi:ParB family chromosome partitioning protein